jgi:hypothetical protein
MKNRIDVNDEEPAEEWLNKLAREAPENELVPPGYEYEDVEDVVIQLTETMVEEREVEEVYEKTVLSSREAEVAVLKQHGLTNAAIHLYFGIGSGIQRYAEDGENSMKPLAKPTIDEYSRRTREKYEKAKETVERFESLYT